MHFLLSLQVLANNFSRNDQPLNLIGSFIDLEQFRIAHQFFHRVILRVPIASKCFPSTGTLNGNDGSISSGMTAR
jgi:hypothetical protein